MSDDFCPTHGYEHMRFQFGNPVPYCNACEDEKDVTMGITYGDHLIDSGHYDITDEQEREMAAREECARRGLNPDDDAADGVLVWMVVDQELRERPLRGEIRHFKNGAGRDRTMLMKPGRWPDYR